MERTAGQPAPIWRTLGYFESGSYSPKLVTDSNGRLIILYVKDNQILVKTWNGTTWIPLGGNIGIDTLFSGILQREISVNSDGIICVVWGEMKTPVNITLFAKRYNR